MTHEERLTRARTSLTGLSVGDALGGFFELSSPRNLSHFVTNRTPPQGTWRFTDDTNMALSIYAILREHQHINQDALAQSFVKHYDRSRGYGRGMRAMVARIGKGQHWREVSYNFYGGNGSYGNGGAMRVAPIGAYFADDLPACITNARASAEITHAHPEGIAGAITIAIAAALAHQHRTTDITSTEFMHAVCEHIPSSEVKTHCERAIAFPIDTPRIELVESLGNGTKMTAQRTVPLALWLSAHYRNNFEEAIWQTLSCGGDTDTIGAMVGGIVAVSAGMAGILVQWLSQREPLPAWAIADA
ncbi:MAG: ADP-ribosylglycohydrolase family protein [Chloroflexota bacterium]